MKNFQKPGGFRIWLTSLGVHADAQSCMEGLLDPDPSKRWSLDKIKEWCGQAPLTPKRGTIGGTTAALLDRWPFRQGVPKAFCVRLPEDWYLHNTKLSECELNVMSRAGFMVLLVVRNGQWKKFYHTSGQAFYTNIEDTSQVLPDSPVEVLTCPSGDTKLCSLDWIYFGRRLQNDNVNIGETTALIKQALHLDEDACVIRFLPEFDVFAFPQHCANAILGGHISFRRDLGRTGKISEAGQHALDLRRAFGINIAGIVRTTGHVDWFPGAEKSTNGYVNEGDRGLLMRVHQIDMDPEFGDTSTPAVSQEKMLQLMNLDLFNSALGLTDKELAAWEAGESAGGTVSSSFSMARERCSNCRIL